MKLERLIDYDFITYLVIGAIILSIISLIILATTLYRRKTKHYRIKTFISTGLFLISLSLVFYYYRPNIIEFQKPVSQDYDIFVYKSQPNSTGGITEKRYELSFEEFSQIIDNLDTVPLSRQIIDWNKNKRGMVQYNIFVIPLIHELNGIYISEIYLYADIGNVFKSYIVASKDGRKQSYQIKDKAKIESLIAELERFTDLSH
ncbi:hypothetical protein [Paenibacillus agri]|uniref:Uncharacterized protein n=1 Tax=Paenibacillus agri TaxID=2744309 RepID=A0A850EFS1_9BACL|nr:hypothetical protein [Paenibacillus agri]NUU59995.1 hypothetical protein [Paenibacillus agri]